jgi:hypothetical protein
MLLFGSVAAALAAAGAFAAWWWLQKRRMTLANSIGLVALGLWAAAVAVKLYVDHAEAESAPVARSGESLAWPIKEPALTLPPLSSSGTGTAVHAAPVDSLIGGLEKRLAAEPDDSAGWALLAQSYAFVANREGAETAVQRAVALGVDEATLRERVQNAQRSAPPVDWVEETLRAARERQRLAAGEAK